MKAEPKYEIGQNVDTDVTIKPMKIVARWWEDKTYIHKNGSWVYRVAFMKKDGEVDKRQNFRQFDESRLTLLS